MLQQIGLNAALTIVSHFVFIMVTFRLMRALRLDQVLKANHVAESRLLIMFLTIAIGYNVSSFFLSLIDAALNLPNLLR